MGKFVLVALFMMVVIVATIAAPADDVKKHMESGERVRALDGQESEEGSGHLRLRRGTCGILGSLGDGPCAASCLATGKDSGTCQDGVCVCSTEDVADKVEGLTNAPDITLPTLPQ